MKMRDRNREECRYEYVNKLIMVLKKVLEERKEMEEKEREEIEVFLKNVYEIALRDNVDTVSNVSTSTAISSISMDNNLTPSKMTSNILSKNSTPKSDIFKNDTPKNDTSKTSLSSPDILLESDIKSDVISDIKLDSELILSESEDSNINELTEKLLNLHKSNKDRLSKLESINIIPLPLDNIKNICNNWEVEENSYFDRISTVHEVLLPLIQKWGQQANINRSSNQLIITPNIQNNKSKWAILFSYVNPSLKIMGILIVAYWLARRYKLIKSLHDISTTITFLINRK